MKTIGTETNIFTLVKLMFVAIQMLFVQSNDDF